MLYCIVSSRKHVERDPNFRLYWTENCPERPCSLGSSINDVTRFWRKIDPNPALVTFRHKSLTPLSKMMSQTYNLLPPPSHQKMNCLYKVVSTV